MASSYYNNYIVAPNPTSAVSIQGTAFNVTLPANIQSETTVILGTLNPSLYPTVGKTYQVTFNFFLDQQFEVGNESGVVNVSLNYWNGVLNSPIASFAGAVNNDIPTIYGGFTLVFTHTSATNVVRLELDNFSTKVIESGVISVKNLAVTDLGFGAKVLTGTPIA